MKATIFLIALWVSFAVYAAEQGKWHWAQEIGYKAYPEFLELGSNGSLWVTGYFNGDRQLSGEKIKNYIFPNGYRFIGQFNLDGKLLHEIIFYSAQGINIGDFSVINNKVYLSMGGQSDIHVSDGPSFAIMNSNYENCVLIYDTITSKLSFTRIPLSYLISSSGNGTSVQGYAQTGGQLHLSKFDSQFNEVWGRTFNASSAVKGEFVISGLGEAFLAFDLFGSVDFGENVMCQSSGFGDIAIARFSDRGKPLSAVSVGGQCTDHVYSIGLSSAGDLHIAGNRAPDRSISCWGVQPSQVFASKIQVMPDGTLSEEWVTRSISGGANLYGQWLDFDARGNLYLAGNCGGYLEWENGIIGKNEELETRDFSGRRELFVTKLSPDGNPEWVLTGNGDMRKGIRGLVVTDRGEGYIIGDYAQDAIFGSDTLVNGKGEGYLAKFCERYPEVNIENIPDLIVTHVSTEKESIFAGDLIQVQVSVKNIGNAPAGESVTRVRLSIDTTLTKQDLLPQNADFLTPVLDAGESVELIHEIAIPDSTPSNRYYIGAFADALSSIGQVNEENDGKLSSRKFTINRKGDHPVIEQPKIQDNKEGFVSFKIPFYGEQNAIYNIKLVDVLTKIWKVIKSYTGKNAIEQHDFPIEATKGMVAYTVERVDLKLPLPGGKRWLLTTEIGCRDCAPENTLTSHIEENYHSLDFDNLNVELGVVAHVPILAAADGYVVETSKENPEKTRYNGNYVVIDHDLPYNGNGLTTRYLHLKEVPIVSMNQQVFQGDQIGIMGKTGDVKTTAGDGVHLHFGLRYNNNGEKAIPELQEITLEGRRLEEFRVSNGSTGSGFYLSTNRILGD